MLATVLLTGALHEDGLADVCDGFGGGWTKERVLAIMKDSATGTFGTAAIVFILLARWLCLVRLVASGHLLWLVAAGVISRTVQVDLAVAHPYARRERGTASPFVRDARIHHLVMAMLVAAAILLAVSRLDWRWLAVLAGGIMVSRLLGAWSRWRIGGVTGDVLGAGNEIVEVLVLVSGVVLGS